MPAEGRAVRLARGVRQALRPARWLEVARCRGALRPWSKIAWGYVARGRLSYPLRVQTPAGLTLQIADRTELTTVWRVFCAREYRVPPGARCIVDLGANTGAFTVFAAERCAATIVAVEPFPSTYARLEVTLQENGLAGRVRALMSAVGGVDGCVQMDDRPGFSNARRVVTVAGDALLAGPVQEVVAPVHDVVEVPAITLATLFERQQLSQVDLLKVDIEGSEYDLLEAAEVEVLRRCRTIAMEYHYAPHRQRIWDLLGAAGFACVRHLPAGWSGLAEFERQG